MMLSKVEAKMMAVSRPGSGIYQCKTCGKWHLYTKRKSNKKVKFKTKILSREEQRHYNPSTLDIFEQKTKDYDPNKLVPSIPPSDFAGDQKKWLEGLIKMGIVDGSAPRVVMMRYADWSRLLDACEP